MKRLINTTRGREQAQRLLCRAALCCALIGAGLADVFAAGPAISFFSPTGGPSGTQVTVVGTNLDGDGAFDTQATINGVAAQVLKLTESEMLLAVAGDLNTSGPLVLHSASGDTSVTQPFLFSPLSAQIQPSRMQIFAGQSRAITAIPLGTGQGVVWSVNGIAGGNATVGTVTQGSLTTTYQAPAAAPVPSNVRVSVALIANPAVTATANVIITDNASGIPDMLLRDEVSDLEISEKVGIKVSRTRILVSLQPGSALGALAPTLKQLNAEIVGGAPEFDVMEIAIPDTGNLTAVEQAIDALTSAPLVAAATYDAEIVAKSLPPDADLTDTIGIRPRGGTRFNLDIPAVSWSWELAPDGNNWGYEFSNFPQAWNWYHYVDNIDQAAPAGSPPPRRVDAGETDTPVNMLSKDLAGIAFRLPTGSQQTDGPSPIGHGSHVAGIMGANWNNKKGITGSSPFIRIIEQPIPGVSAGTYGTSMINAMRLLIRSSKNLRVINVSYGYNWDYFPGDLNSNYPYINGFAKWNYRGFNTSNGFQPTRLWDISETPEFTSYSQVMVIKHGKMARDMAAWIGKTASGQNAIIASAAGNEAKDPAVFAANHGLSDETATHAAPGYATRRTHWINFSAEFGNPWNWASYNGAQNIVVVEALQKRSDRTQLVRSTYSNAARPNSAHPGWDFGFSAPGDAIISVSTVNTSATLNGIFTDESAYEEMWGTSMAAPQVAGLIAYLCALDPKLSIADIISILRSSSRFHGNSSGSVIGAPAIDAFKAVMQIDEINKNDPTRKKLMKRALLNVDDGTVDGDDRNVAADNFGTGIVPADMHINMSDFRRFRDAFLQTHGYEPNLNGPADSKKRDLNEDGIILPATATTGTDESTYARFDFNGDGKIELDDLDVMGDVELWDDADIAAPGTDAQFAAALKATILSGDCKLDADAVFADADIDEIRVSALALHDDGTNDKLGMKLHRTDVLTPQRDSRKIFTLPAGQDLRIWASAYRQGQFQYFVMAPEAAAKTKIKPGQDVILNLKKTEVAVVPSTFAVSYGDKALFNVVATIDGGQKVALDKDFFKVNVSAPPELGAVGPASVAPDADAGAYQLSASNAPGTFTIRATIKTETGDPVNTAAEPEAKATATVRTAIVKNPGGLALDGLRNLYVTDTLEGNVLFIPPGDAGLKLLTGLDHPGPIDVDPKGRSLIVGEAGGKVTRYFFGLSGKVVDQAGALVVGANVFVDTPAGTIPGTGAVPNRIKTSTDGRFTVLGLLAPEMGKDPVKVAVTIEYNGKTQAFPVTLKTTGQTILEFKLTD